MRTALFWVHLFHSPTFLPVKTDRRCRRRGRVPLADLAARGLGGGGLPPLLLLLLLLAASMAT